MSKPQSPRSRPAGAPRAAAEGRDGRSFFSRPKGESRDAAPRERAPRDERASGREDRGSFGSERREERGNFGAERREGQGLSLIHI